VQNERIFTFQSPATTTRTQKRTARIFKTMASVVVVGRAFASSSSISSGDLSSNNSATTKMSVAAAVAARRGLSSSALLSFKSANAAMLGKRRTHHRHRACFARGASSSSSERQHELSPPTRKTNEFVQLSKKAAPPAPAPQQLSTFEQVLYGGIALTAASVLKRELAPGCELIDGKQIAQEIREEIKEKVEKMKTITNGNTPGLAVVLVGERKDSQSYVRSKKKMCAEVGIRSEGTDLPEDATEEEVLKVVRAYNADPNIHGILVQLPMPKHINEERVLKEVSYEKDVDGFHPLNIGALSQRGREDPRFVPCTPRGCIELLKRSNVEMKGKKAVVVGRSNVVGTPAALLLQRNDATVTVVHSRTKNPEEAIRDADIVIAACGVTEYVQGSWLKPGAAVIDVGINAKDDATKKLGYRLVGDCDFESCKKVAGKMTPVPGGVGPMTIAILLQNTLEGAARSYGVSEQLGLKN
jgi:5,10-methylene-tetrahydrofolate dehydrogenase/methenyl tetrahydrofolate cyclohydrolase